ncbi:DNA adenine methylase, partial [Stenotrophomonas maltophilia]|uniref:DNA adenine methylase n=1 Tax=Stenotrophomonas maltophilia TaxID=40324 RepID=UPI001954A341
ADKVANTAGTYYAFLKAFDRKALKPIVLEPLPISNNGFENSCHLLDAQQVSGATEADILYLDPPYNVRD